MSGYRGKDTTRGYKRWLRAMNNAKLRPHTEAAEQFRSRVAVAEQVNELTGLGGDSVLVESWSATKWAPVKYPADASLRRPTHQVVDTTVREYYCSFYCAALAVQIGRNMTAEEVYSLLSGKVEVNRYTGRKFSKVDPGTPHRAAYCRTCHAKIKDGRVVEQGHDITVLNPEPLQTKTQIKKEATTKVDARDAEIARLKEIIRNHEVSIKNQSDRILSLGAETGKLRVQLAERDRRITDLDVELQRTYSALDASQTQARDAEAAYQRETELADRWANKCAGQADELRALEDKLRAAPAAPANEIVVRVVIEGR